MSDMVERAPAEVFSLAEHLAEEMQARGWTTEDVARRMGGSDGLHIRLFKLDLIMCVTPKHDNLIVDDEFFEQLERADSRSYSRRWTVSDTDFLMQAAWSDYLAFAIQSAEAREAFERETGIAFPAAPKSQIDAMIDEATGHRDAVIRDFAYWATLRQWGDEGVPEKFLAEARARFGGLAA